MTAVITAALGTVTFNVCDKNYIMSSEEASTFAQGVIASQKSNPSYFTNVTTAYAQAEARVKVLYDVDSTRSTSTTKLSQNMLLCICAGPFTAQQFIEMMKFPQYSDMESAYQHLHQFKAVSLSSMQK